MQMRRDRRARQRRRRIDALIEHERFSGAGRQNDARRSCLRRCGINEPRQNDGRDQRRARGARPPYRHRVLGGSFFALGRRAGRCSSALALFDEGLHLLAAFLTDLFVEGRAVTIASRLATFLSALLSDLLVKCMPMRGLSSLTALTADVLVELGPVLTFNGLAAFLAGFPNGHSAA